MNITGAIFDVDGTLLDSMGVWLDIGTLYLQTKGLTPHEGHNLTEVFRSMTLTQSANYFRAHYGITDTVSAIIDDMNALVTDFYQNHVTCKPGVVRLLNDLTERDVRLCIVTASDRGVIEAGLARCGISHYFLRIFTCTEEGNGKDEPAIFRTALHWLGTEKASTYVFEDALYAIQTAKKEGFPVVAVYDKSAEEQQSAIRTLADHYLSSFTEWETLR